MSFPVRALTLICCLFVVAALPASDWTGSGSDALWSTNANWNGGVAPISGGAVAFPAGPAATTPVNDLAGLTFTPTFAGHGYILVGQGITLGWVMTASADNSVNIVGLPMVLPAQRTITVDPTTALAPVTLILGGPLSGAGSVRKTGTGTLVLTGGDTLTGTSRAEGGTLLVGGTLSGRVSLLGGTLAGDGIVGGITTGSIAGSVVRPGREWAGVLTVNGDVILDSTDELIMPIFGNVPGIHYSQLSVKGAVTLASPLILDMGFNPSPGMTFTLIDNDDTDPITVVPGPGLPPQSGFLVTDAGTMQVSYTGGSGNDLVVTCLAAKEISYVSVGVASPSVTVGTPVSIFALMSGAHGGSPSGSVEFHDGLTLLGTASIIAGEATLTTSSLAVGTHLITARYRGDATYGPSSWGTLGMQIKPASGTFATGLTLTSSLASAPVGQPVTYAAQMWSVGGVPGGTVTFRADGVDIPGAVALAVDAQGRASTTTTFASPGTRSITAVYSGAVAFAAATSPVVSQPVVAAGSIATVTTLDSSKNPAVLGDFVSFTATVAGGASPTGAVRFLRGSAQLAVVPLSGGTAVLITAAIPGGTSLITATYQGDGTSAASTSVVLSQVVIGTGSGGGGGGGTVEGGGGGCGAGGGAAVAALLTLGLVGRRRR
jgi:hypothetical protein